MKVCLVTLTPDADLGSYRIGRFMEDLGVAYLASALEQAGHHVIVVDSAMIRVDDNSLVQNIVEVNPDVNGFSDSGETFNRLCKMAAFLKKQLPECYLVIGDCMPTIIGSTNF